MVETPLRILVRDGTEDDIAACLALDSRYETGHVLQVYLHGAESHGWNISLQRERLPRPVELSQPVHRAVLRKALEREHCFLVAESRADDKAVVGCLVLTPDSERGFGLIECLIVSAKTRRQQVGVRLMAASRIWAREHELNRLIAETQTKNAPAISFFESLGFTFCGFNDRYFPDESIALFFSLPLKPAHG
jgi:N-acetylglutamate synthase-like GNAT family acetyltransferase